MPTTDPHDHPALDARQPEALTAEQIRERAKRGPHWGPDDDALEDAVSEAEREWIHGAD